MGPGHETGVEMGPLVTRQHLEKVRGYVDAGEKAGAGSSPTAATWWSKATRMAFSSVPPCSTT